MTRKLLWMILPLMLLFLMVIACRQASAILPEKPGGAAQPAVQTAPAALPTYAPTAPPSGGVKEAGQPLPVVPAALPAVTPEEVVVQFLTAYQVTPEDVTGFLHADAEKRFQEDGVYGVLGFNGALEGMQILSGSLRSILPPAAQVEVGMQVNGTQTVRIFYLVVVNDVWKIEAVRMPG